jgi:hypothetical protein
MRQGVEQEDKEDGKLKGLMTCANCAKNAQNAFAN